MGIKSLSAAMTSHCTNGSKTFLVIFPKYIKNICNYIQLSACWAVVITSAKIWQCFKAIQIVDCCVVAQNVVATLELHFNIEFVNCFAMLNVTDALTFFRGITLLLTRAQYLLNKNKNFKLFNLTYLERRYKNHCLSFVH